MADTDKKQYVAKLNPVDANGLALMCFGFSTFMFFAFLCNIQEVATTNNGVMYLGDMLTWGVALGLVTAGVIQGNNGDHLGFTSYIFHAAILGTIGYNFKMAVTLGENAGPFHLIGFFCYAAFWFNCIFTIMAFRLSAMIGGLYATVALMFLLVGLNFQQMMGENGPMIAGVSCLVVSAQCFYYLFPVLAGVQLSS
eukprot:TRINITY_DN262_c0_g1_i6.p1 TRINITY_DN262_c0_g1~~TRINITY_DN262_c0_g1_i6.p1  ORF type:complete len:196 (+),score=43.06 TRINITY_DN262_c0_g1_i6:75-662(+)